MKITSEKLEISPDEVILWQDVESMRLLNDKLDLVLSDGRVMPLKNLRRSTLDLIFRSYENYLKDHPEKRPKGS